MKRILRVLAVSIALLVPVAATAACGDGSETGKVSKVLMKDGKCQVELWEGVDHVMTNWVTIETDSVACKLGDPGGGTYYQMDKSVTLTFPGTRYTDTKVGSKTRGVACIIERAYKDGTVNLPYKTKAECDKLPAEKTYKDQTVTVEATISG